MDKYRHRNRSDSRDRVYGDRKRDRSGERERSGDREGLYRRRKEAILSGLKDVQPLEVKRRDAILHFARDIDRNVPCSDKEGKELFVGNVIDQDASQDNLCLLFNTAMRKLGLVNESDEPVLECRNKSNYCFLFFRSSWECSMALNFSGIPFKDSLLRIRRPTEYPGRTDAIFTWEDLLPQRREFKPPVVEHRAPILYRQPPLIAHTPAAVRTPVALIAPAPVPVTIPVPHPATRNLRDIFIGGINEQMTEDSLRDLVGGALFKMGLSNSHAEHPVVRAIIKGSFAFLEMRTSIDAANALNLSNIPSVAVSCTSRAPTSTTVAR